MTKQTEGTRIARLLQQLSGKGRKLSEQERVLTRDSAIVDIALQRGLIERRQGLMRPTQAGLMLLKRAMSTGDPFQEQHRATVRSEVEPGGRPLDVNTAESPLTWLRHRRGRDGQPLLSDAQFEAGERLRRDFTFGQLEQRITASWSVGGAGLQKRRAPGGGHTDLGDRAIDARQRVNRALKAVGPDLSVLLLDICCELRGLEETEKRRDLPRRSGKVLLQYGLNALARHYGLMS